MSAYAYVGPPEHLETVRSHAPGRVLASLSDVEHWCASTTPDAPLHWATFVIDLEGHLRVLPRSAEHVWCAGGQDVLAAGEIAFKCGGGKPQVAHLSNISGGYKPEPDSWPVVREALVKVGLDPPPGWTEAVVFRVCRCGQENMQHAEEPYCKFCLDILPADRNV